jgi:GNAT superfamily N-acetyltransferase
MELIDPDDDAYAQYSDNFTAYNASHSTWHVQTFSIVHRNRTKIIAGGRGIVNMGALEIRGLWVDAAQRRSGLGSALLTAIETEAVSRGASRAMLFTFDWQAEAFYRKAGYREFGRFQYPDGYARIDMQKDL